MDQDRAFQKVFPRELQRFGHHVLSFCDGGGVDEEAGAEPPECLDLEVRHLRAAAGNDRGGPRWAGGTRGFWLDAGSAGSRQPSDES